MEHVADLWLLGMLMIFVGLALGGVAMCSVAVIGLGLKAWRSL